MYITNCMAEGNYKYGFFFEHQGRFSGYYTASDAEGFVVANCTAKWNRYDFGGLRANDVTYENCISELDNRNYVAINFEDMSRDIHIVNCKVNRQFKDVTYSSDYYYEAVYWALNNGITNGTSKTEFSQNAISTRGQAVILLWRMAERPGEVVYRTDEILNKQFEKIYTDVPSNASYVDAVNWAVSKGIVEGKSSDKFYPDDICTRAEIVTLLYRFANRNDEFSITYNLGGGKLVESNPTSYEVGNEITLNNSSREGYTFLGWTGSNYSEYVESNCYIPELIAKINSSDIGNKTYTANWVANNYEISFDSNDRTGTMDNQYFIYDDILQKLLKNNFKTYSGYMAPAKQTVTVAADGTTVVKYYYTKKSITQIIQKLCIY